MDSKKRSYKLFRWLALTTQVLAVGGLISLSAYAQGPSHQQVSQDKAADAVIPTEAVSASAATTPGTAATVPAAVPNPTPLPPSSGGSWTGFYVGGHIGYGWGRADTTFTPLPTAVQFINLAPTTLRPDPKGLNGGFQGGYNHQWGSFVAGIEADMSWARMRGTAIAVGFAQNTGPAWNGTLTAHQDTTWFGTLRPRAGAAFGRVLVYGTAGLAYGHVNYSANADFRPQGTIQYPASFGKTKKGWAAGGGAEIAVAKHVSVKAEYLYYNLGNESITANPVPTNPPFQVAFAWQTKAHTFNGGVNFHF
jgi:outer membrane immunogenic protein